MSLPRLRFNKLYHKVYGHYLGVLLVTTLVISAIGWFAFASSTSGHFYRHLAGDVRLIASEAGAAWEGPQRAAMLARLHVLGIHVSILDMRGSEIFRRGPAFPALLPAELESSARQGSFVTRRDSSVFALVPIVAKGAQVGWAVGGFHHVARPARGIAMLLSAIALIGLLIYPLVRHIARPIEELTVAAQRVGAGDFSVRAKVKPGDEIGTLALAFNDMTERIATLMRAQRELLANVSHELRTPLTRIRLASELANDATDPSARAKWLATINEELGELDALIGDLLEATRFDLGKATVAPRPTPLRPMLEKFIERAGLVEDGAQRVELDLDASLAEGSVLADAPLVNRVLDNLVGNARRHSEAQTPIVVRGRAVPEGVQIDVSDRGVGIAEAEIERVFEPFYRADRSREKATSGYGLGLAIARKIVQLHGGRIWAESRAGNGTTFSFTLPRA